MRAVGYVAPHRAPIPSDDDQDRVSWSAIVEPSAGSWSAQTGRLSTETLPEDPAARIVNHCAHGGHNLVAIFGVEGGASSLMEQLGLPVQAKEDDDGASRVQLDDLQFRNLLSVLTPPAGHPALVLLHDASHLADDVETLIRRLVLIRRTGSDAQCTDPDAPDPLLSGLSMLALTPEDAQSANGDVDVDDESDAMGESPAIGARVRDARPKLVELASGGRVLGRTPYGYRSSADGMLEPVAHEAQVVRRVFDWYTGRNGGDVAPIGMRTIVQRLQDGGINTRSGKPWSTAAISLMLKNRAYVGTYERYGFMVAGNHEPLIERAVFNAAQGRMSKPRAGMAVPAEADAPFLLGGLVRCGHCTHSIPGLSRKRTWQRKDDSVATKVYRYYEFAECPNRRRSRGAADDSAGWRAECPSWRADDLEGLVKQHILKLSAAEQAEITPRDADSDLDQLFGDARRRFAAAVEQVAIGKGDLEHLSAELESLGEMRRRLRERDDSGVRRGRGSAARTRRLVKDHVSNLAADIDWRTSRDAVHALVDYIAVTDDDATVVMLTR